MEQTVLTPAHIEDGAGAFFETIQAETGQAPQEAVRPAALPAPTFAEACLALELLGDSLNQTAIVVSPQHHGRLQLLPGLKVIVQAPFRDAAKHEAWLPVPGVILPADPAAPGLRIGYLAAPNDIYADREALQAATGRPLSPVQLPLLEMMLAQHLPGVGEHQAGDPVVPLVDTGHAAAIAAVATPTNIHTTLHGFTAPESQGVTGPSQLGPRIAGTGALHIGTDQGERTVAQHILEATHIGKVIIPQAFQEQSPLQTDVRLAPAQLVVGMIAAAASTRPQATRPDIRRNAHAMVQGG